MRFRFMDIGVKTAFALVLAAPVAPSLIPVAHAQAVTRATNWWNQFNDPMLDETVDRALTSNLDLAVAAARLQQARALAQGTRAALLPAIGGTGSAQSASQSLNTPIGAASNALGFARGYSLYQAGLEAQWEVDLFGGLSARRRAAVAGVGASAAQADAMRLAVVAETVDAYVRLRGLQERLALAERQERLRRDLAGLIRLRASQGLSSDLDATRAEAAVAAIASALPPLRAAIAVEVDWLGVLTGGGTGEGWAARLRQASPIPVALEPALDADPALLMRRRPDLAAAEQAVLGTRAGVSAARAEYYPHLSFGGLLGLASLGTLSFASGDAVTASGGASLRWRLFDFGRVDAEVASARGREQEALARWRQAALVASAEVADAIAALAEGRQEQAELVRQVALLTRARDQAQAAYANGAVTMIDVLDADRALLDATDRLASNRTALARASVAAVRAMGGGYGKEAENHG